MSLLKFEQIIGKTLQILSQANSFVASISASITASRSFLLPDKSGTIAVVSDITNAEQYGKFTGLKSNYYLLGNDLGAIPVAGGQSAIVSYHGLRLGGHNGSTLYNSSYVPYDPPLIGNIENRSTFVVGICAGATQAPWHTGVGTTNALGILNLYQTSWHTNGTFINCKNSSMVSKFSVNLNGELFVGTDKVIGARETGWTTAIGTSNKGTFNTATATATECAQRIKALEDMLRAHGLIN
ncbi:MAG: hypothetical protein KME60_03275 [Cyanomargarita calcarea GSE-NOS-MK-12-04C]|jgi:hypothetical protein|uniref:Uncharacterized protein n=1 Tax=Cyanomargarita calcarea GSE-NOS-MK-12-04C TaxID=2839659 RepID=A0A951UR91_9CYAN|nr:hypothetical protein [Cyanomargarita calcarea GSE-NOS-MK-12-04C]